MVNFEYGKDRYIITDKWEEITLETAIKVMQVYNRFPDNLKALYMIATDENEKEEADRLEAALSDKEQKKIIPALYAEIFCLLSTVSQEDIKYWNELEIRAMYTEYCLSKVYGLLLMPVDYKVTAAPSFNFKGVDYYYPETREILGRPKPLSNTTALEFTEVADLELAAKELQGGKYEVAANIISILCRPNGEEYNEETSLERAKEFLQLPMSIVWEVFFYILTPLTLSKQRAQISLMEAAIEAGKRPKNQD